MGHATLNMYRPFLVQSIHKLSITDINHIQVRPSHHQLFEKLLFRQDLEQKNVDFTQFLFSVSSHHHIHPLQQHFEANEASSVNKISQSNAGSDTDLNTIEDESNVLNLSRRRNSDTNSNNNNNNNNNNLNAHNNNHKSKNGSSTPPRSVYVSICYAIHFGIDKI